MISPQPEERRFLSVAHNLRDWGGYAATDGTRVRRGLLFRSAAPDGEGRKLRTLLQPLNLKTIIDLRPETEQRGNSPAPQGVRKITVPFDVDAIARKRLKPLLFRRGAREEIRGIIRSLYGGLTNDRLGQIGELFRIFIAPESYPILIRCRAGKDRTGFVCALAQLALGVGREEIIEEYLLTNAYILPRVRRAARFMRIASLGLAPPDNFELAFAARAEYIDLVIDTIAATYGGVNRYLEGCGITSPQLDGLREFLLEPATTSL